MREIVKDTVRLRELVSESVGVVHNPFDKRMHHAGCSIVRERIRATANGPVWFFPSHAEATEFLAGDVERYTTMRHPQPRPVAACAPVNRAVAGSPMKPSAGLEPATPSLRHATPADG
jgi:hypothetical protein